MIAIEARGISKSFGGVPALRDVSLSVRQGELVALLGPSGSGKTTLLRIIAGLESADSRCVPALLLNGEDATRRPTGRRGAGFVFQHYALFRHLTVFENIAFGLRVKPRRERASEEAIRARVSALLDLIQLAGQAGRFPAQLSGGQRQRVALARVLAVEPRFLLLDEPFGALDPQVRKELRRWLRRLHDEIGLTSVFVTHDQEEAMEVADRVVVMNQGRIEQVGTPEEVFHHPATEFVMRFVGQANLFPGRVEEGRVVLGEGEARFPLSPHLGAPPHLTSGEVRVFVRPGDLEVAPSPHGMASIPAIVLRVNAAGPLVRLYLRGGEGGELLAELPHGRFLQLGIGEGSRVWLGINRVHVFSTGPAADLAEERHGPSGRP